MNHQRIVLLARKGFCIASRHEGRIYAILFIGALLATLSAGLWPFSSPANAVQWVPGQNGIRFGRYGTALSRGNLKFANESERACTIELLLKPHTPWTRGTPLAFYDRATRTSFEVRQLYADLQLVMTRRIGFSDVEFRSLQVPDVFLKTEFLLTIASDGRQTAIYENGQLVAKSTKLIFSSSNLSGQVILGNSPVRNHEWSGEIKGLAVYGEALNSQAVFRHNEEWWTAPAPSFTSQKPVALFLFGESHGRVIHDFGTSAADLELPAKYVTVDQVRFENRLSEALDPNYRDDAIFNVFGFVPLGFISGLFFRRLSSKGTAAAAAIAVGLATSLIIEYFQSFLPTRFSGTTDLVTNTLGTAIGVAMGFLVLRFLPIRKWVERLHAQPK